MINNMIDYELDYAAMWFLNNPRAKIDNETLSDLIMVSEECKQIILNDASCFKNRMNEIVRKEKEKKAKLEIPESLDNWFLSNEWGEDYWKEIPQNWKEWSNKELKKYPITCEIWNWKKSL
jgi:hypothetical protein